MTRDRSEIPCRLQGISFTASCLGAFLLALPLACGSDGASKGAPTAGADAGGTTGADGGVGTGTSPDGGSYVASWIGNSFSGASWMQFNVDAITVLSDGTVATNTIWDEGTHEFALYKDGAYVSSPADLHGFGRSGGQAITNDGKYIYVALSQAGCKGAVTTPNVNGFPQYPPCTTPRTVWNGIRRYTTAGQPAPFAAGYGFDGAMLVVNTNTSTPTSGQLAGLTVSSGELYASDGQSIRVYDTATLSMTPKRTWAANGVGAIAADREGYILAVDSSGAKVVRYSSSGALAPQSVTFPSRSSIQSLFVDSQDRLLVADAGPDQNVKTFTQIATSPTPGTPIGVQGGILAAPKGQIGPNRLNGPTGVAVDPAGNVYVSCNGRGHLGPTAPDGGANNTDIRAFSPSGDLKWRIFANEFVDMAVPDPTRDGADLYTKDTHYVLDLTKSPGQEATDVGYTLDAFSYPDDARLHLGNLHPYVRAVAYVSGAKILFLSTMHQDGLFMYRFDGEIAVPSGWFSGGPIKPMNGWPTEPNVSAGFIWADANGDGTMDNSEFLVGTKDQGGSWGWSVDSNGTVWEAEVSTGVVAFPAGGLDAHGTPLYSYTTAVTYPMPSDFGELRRLEYDAKNDVMYLAGLPPGGSLGNCWNSSGMLFARYDGWMKNKGVVKATWTLKPPYDCSSRTGNVPMGLSIAGDRVFIAEAESGNVSVYSKSNGMLETTLSPAPQVSGWLDTLFPLAAFQRSNGEYLVFVENDLRAEIIMYRW